MGWGSGRKDCRYYRRGISNWLRALLEQLETVPDVIPLMDALRMEMDKPKADVGVTVTNGQWLGSLLTRLRADRPEAWVLLVVPASLLGNWRREAERLAPETERLSKKV